MATACCLGTWVWLPARSHASNTMTHHLMLLCSNHTAFRPNRGFHEQPQRSPCFPVNYCRPNTCTPLCPRPGTEARVRRPIAHDGSRDVGRVCPRCFDSFGVGAGCICGQACLLNSSISSHSDQNIKPPRTHLRSLRILSLASAVSLAHSGLLKRYGCVCPRAIVVPEGAGTNTRPICDRHVPVWGSWLKLRLVVTVAAKRPAAA